MTSSSTQEPSTTDEGENWSLGVILGLLGSVAINTGNNLQSLGLKSLREEAEDADLRRAAGEEASEPKGGGVVRKSLLLVGKTGPARTVPFETNGDDPKGGGGPSLEQ